MHLLKHLLFVLSLSISCVVVAKDLRIVIGAELPPYVFNRMSSGIEIDIIKEALKVKDHTVSFEVVPYMRLQSSLKAREVDGIAQNTVYDIGKEANVIVHESDTTVKYHNFAITFLDKNFKIESIQELANKKILAFQNSNRYLGPVYAAMANTNARYREHPSQAFQIKQLYSGKVDVVIADKRIFYYWKNHAQSEGGLDPKNKMRQLKFHSIFEASARNVKFLDRDIRDDFNYGLGVIKANGLYGDILDSYENM